MKVVNVKLDVFNPTDTKIKFDLPLCQQKKYVYTPVCLCLCVHHW